MAGESAPDEQRQISAARDRAARAAGAATRRREYLRMDPWNSMRKLTTARIAIGRTGGSMLTEERLNFLLAHARARDAVLAAFDAVALANEVSCIVPRPPIILDSAARDRAEYLQRPDLGRQLS